MGSNTYYRGRLRIKGDINDEVINVVESAIDDSYDLDYNERDHTIGHNGREKCNDLGDSINDLIEFGRKYLNEFELEGFILAIDDYQGVYEIYVNDEGLVSERNLIDEDKYKEEWDNS